MIVAVPAVEKSLTPWPTLGPQVCEWIEGNLVFGPGDLRGEPARLDAEKRGLIYRMYEVFPKGHAKAGRRRFRRVAVSLRKGSAKTELAAWLAAAELHPRAPVRCSGFDRKGNPLAVGVRDPYIPMVAYTEEQSEDLAYGALYVILQESKRITKDFDIGLERIMRVHGDGKAVALASAPDARDGARTTFQHFDETHRFTLPRLKKAYRTMLANLPKRMLADPWSLETTTAPAPGELSVAEDTMAYAASVEAGKVKDSALFFFHRQASDGHDLTTKKGIRAAVKEASGPVAEWSNIDAIVDQWSDPTADRTYLERVWLNRLVQAQAQAFDSRRWAQLSKPAYVIPDGALVAVGFDGSRRRDSTAIVVTEIDTGFQHLFRAWEKPYVAHENEETKAWEIPAAEVQEAMAAVFARWDVWRLYADPPYWESTVDEWSGEYGEERVIKWRTNQWTKIAAACRAYQNAITDGSLSHDGSAVFSQHIGNVHQLELNGRAEDGTRRWVMVKARKDSQNKIDVAMAGCLSWLARSDAVSLGANRTTESIYDQRAAAGQPLIDSW